MIDLFIYLSVYLLSVAEVKTVSLTLTDDAAAYQKYIAMYDFTARNFDELSLKAGEHVLVIILPFMHMLSLNADELTE